MLKHKTYETLIIIKETNIYMFIDASSYMLATYWPPYERTKMIQIQQHLLRAVDKLGAKRARPAIFFSLIAESDG